MATTAQFAPRVKHSAPSRSYSLQTASLQTAGQVTDRHNLLLSPLHHPMECLEGGRERWRRARGTCQLPSPYLLLYAADVPARIVSRVQVLAHSVTAARRATCWLAPALRTAEAPACNHCSLSQPSEDPSHSLSLHFTGETGDTVYFVFRKLERSSTKSRDRCCCQHHLSHVYQYPDSFAYTEIV